MGVIVPVYSYREFLYLGVAPNMRTEMISRGQMVERSG